MNHLKDIVVLVLGLGESGLAMARWCAGHGAQVRVWDSREQAPHDASLQEHVPEAQRLSGLLGEDALKDVRLVLKSPGLAPTDERIAGLLATARQTGLPVQGELDLFARALADLKTARGYSPKVIAITGTNGKTTTTSMTAQLIERADKRVAVAGNIGPTMLQTLQEALAAEPPPLQAEVVPDAPSNAVAEAADLVVPDAPVTEPTAPLSEDAIDQAALHAEDSAAAAVPAPVPDDRVADDEAVAAAQAEEPVAQPIADAPVDDEPSGGGPPAHLIPPPPPGPVFEVLPEVWVLELSSFQLDGVQGFEPSAAVVLNVTQDHLDWHGTMADYAAAKARIYGTQAVVVVNRDDPLVEQMIPAPTKEPGKGRFAKFVERRVVRFGLEAPTRPGDYGLLAENGMTWLVRALEADETVKKPRKSAAAVEAEELIIQRLMPADALRVRGRHNAANALAALALATAVGCPLAPMLHGLREYAGEPHRVEFIASVNGVEAYDDSKGTNVGATVAALGGLGEDKAPGKLVVILGGDGKGQDFTPLALPVQRHARAVATIGRDAAAIEAVLQDAQVPLQRHDTLQAATQWAFQRAHAGDAVLLSPACASLDMFRNYAHRAEVFVAEVRSLAAATGEVA